MRIGTVCYCTDQGLGMLAKSFYDAGVMTEVAIFSHPKRGVNHHDWFPGAPVIGTRDLTNRDEVKDMISKVDVMLFFETPFDWSLLPYCREHGVKTVIVPMYEWTPRTPPFLPDKWICPSLLDQQYFPTHPFLPI